MHMVMFVLDDPDKLDAVLDAWQTVGVSGATILESSGLYRRQQQRPVGARYAFGLARGLRRVESGHYTLFVIVPSLDAAQACLSAAETIVGNLDGPDTGVLAAWELDVVKGVPPHLNHRTDEGKP
ncbi:MAG: hypothetical protein JXQ72_15180 [Anaerolineae bacterium]|nr:hypothetical protein [Anaerolineae bacterium]